MGLFFYTMELDTRELIRCLARDCNNRDEKLCDVSKADCIARDCSQRSEALGGFWSFLKLYMYIQIETFTYAITSHKKRRAKYQTKMLSWIAKQQFRYKQCFQRNNTLTADTDDQKFNCDNANGHSQTGNRINSCRFVLISDRPFSCQRQTSLNTDLHSMQITAVKLTRCDDREVKFEFCFDLRRLNFLAVL